jgi:hypothetical protein
MIGYTPAEQAIRDSRGQPPATGADQPPAWHDYDARAIEFGGASDVGLPDDAAAVTPEWWRP